MEHSKHIIRAVLLVVLAVLVFVVGRHFLVPESFGEFGHYRYASVADFTAPLPQHGGRAACAECHDEEGEIVAEGTHNAVTCELCHGPLGTHVQANPETGALEKKVESGDMPVHRTVALCAYCHEQLEARPENFPQVVLREHVAAQGEQWSEAVCLECHDAHNPSE